MTRNPGVRAWMDAYMRVTTKKKDMTPRCACCKDKQQVDRMTKTLDSEWLCWQCYTVTTTELRKGVCELYEAQAIQGFLERYEALVILAVSMIRKVVSLRSGDLNAQVTEVRQVFREFEELERDLALRFYSKDRCTLTRTEHYHLLEQLVLIPELVQANSVPINPQYLGKGKYGGRLTAEYLERLAATSPQESWKRMLGTQNSDLRGYGWVDSDFDAVTELEGLDGSLPG